MKKTIHTILALALFSQWPQLAAAQSAASPPGAPAKAASAAQGKAEEPAVDKVIVTANRRIETLQTVSGVVQTIDGEQLRKDGITEIRQLQNEIPGMNIANQEGNVEIYIRGVGSSNNTELGDPAAAPHINGIYIPRPRGMGTMFYDLERVEVNKGPQGTLYGRNAMAGTLNIITAKPRLDRFGGYMQFEGGDRSSGAEAALNLPLSPTFALRAAAFMTDKTSGFRNASPDPASHALMPAGEEHNQGARLSALLVPTDRMQISLMADYGHEGGTGYPGANIYTAVKATGLRAEQLPLRDIVYRGAQGTMHNDLSGVQGKASYDFDSFGAELSLSQRKVDFYQRNAQSEGIAWPGRDYSGVPWDNFSTQYWQTKSDSKVGELRLYSGEDAKVFQWNLGLFGFNENQKVGYLSLADDGYCCFSGTEFTMPKVIGKSTALFGDGTLAVTSNLRMIGGLRETQEAKSRYGIGGNIALTLGAENLSDPLHPNLFACCIATRLGTEGFQPNLLARPNFDMSKVVTPQQMAQFLMETSMTPGARDTVNSQVGPIASGTNPLGACDARSDISNGLTCPTSGAFSFANLAVPEQQVGSSKFHYTDWRLGTEYDITKDNMVYVKVSTGHKAGGFNDSFHGSSVPELFRPEQLHVLEVGSRNAFDLGGRRAVFNVSGFYYDYKDQVFQDLTCITVDTTQNPPTCSGYSLVNRNIGKSHLAGLEAEGRFALPMGFKLDLNGALLHTRIDRGVVADVRAIDYSQGGKSPLIDLTGNALPLASKVNLSARLQQVFGLAGGKADWQALLNWRSAYYLTQFNEKAVVAINGDTTTALQAGFPDRQVGFLTLNLGAGYSFAGGLRLEAYVNNATDKQVSQKALVGASLDIRFLNDARSYGARARMDF
jgi:iron complex outermembrane recepter protein